MKVLPDAEIAAARQRLADLANSLQEHKFFGPAKAIRGYLNKKFATLDEAFGLTPLRRRRGAPADPDRAILIAREIDPLKRKGKTWLEVADALDKPGFHAEGLDERQLRRIYDAHMDAASGTFSKWHRTSQEKASIVTELERRLAKKDEIPPRLRARAKRVPRSKPTPGGKIEKPRKSLRR